MRARTLSELLVVLTLAAPTLRAQASDALYTRLSALTGWETRGYTFDGDIPSTSQWRVPLIAVVPLGRRMSLDLTTNYAHSSLDQGDSVGTQTLSGFTDTQMRVLYTLTRDRLVTSVSLNLPTGKQDLTASEFEVAGAVGSNYLSFPVAAAGTGFSATAGLAWVRPLGSWNLGFSGSYRYQTAYTALGDVSGTVEYDPGSEFRVRGGLDRLFGQRTRMTVGLTFSTFSTDDFSGSGVTPGTYQPGPRLIGEFALTQAVGRSTLSFVAWDYYRTAGDTNDVTDPRTQENVLNAEVRWGIPVARRVQVEPLIGYRQYDLKAFTGGRMYSGAVTARFGLSDRMSASVAGRFDTGWVASEQVSETDLTGFGLTAFLRYTR